MILTVCFANEEVARRSYSRLAMSTDEVVLLWDNHYPGTDAKSICGDFGFVYADGGENVGVYEAYNSMLRMLPPNKDRVIMYDSDNYPVTDGWDSALLNVLGGDVVHSTLNNYISERELNERGYTPAIIKGIACKVTHQPVTNTTCAFLVSFLQECGGLTGGNKYYGGNEIAMWKHYEGKKWAFLTDYREDTELLKGLHDWQYTQYKLLYAHRGLGMSYTEYLETNPVRNDNLAKQIFG